jgi:hypothetical protein
VDGGVATREPLPVLRGLAVRAAFMVGTVVALGAALPPAVTVMRSSRPAVPPAVAAAPAHIRA